MVVAYSVLIELIIFEHILSTRCNKDDVTWHVRRFWETLRQ